MTATWGSEPFLHPEEASATSLTKGINVGMEQPSGAPDPRRATNESHTSPAADMGRHDDPIPSVSSASKEASGFTPSLKHVRIGAACEDAG
jgi:hypothetical protein